MNHKQATNLHAATVAWTQVLALKYPCQDCDGSGETAFYTAGCEPGPCPACWGRGYTLPETEEAVA